MRTSIAPLTFALLAAGCGAQEPNPALVTPEESLDAATGAPSVLRDVVYARRDGAEPSLTSLDLFRADAPNRPTLVLVHGGGWRSGDKVNFETAGNTADLLARGYNVVSINMRLVGDPRSPNTTPEQQAEDVASAARWVFDNARRFALDPARVSLLGYSSGAHLVALVGTDPGYLGAEGLDLDVMHAIVPVDVSAYDVPHAVDNACALEFCDAANNLPRIFGEDPAAQRRLSPQAYVTPGRRNSPFMIVSAGFKDQQAQTLTLVQAERLRAALADVGTIAAHHHEPDLDHTELMGALATEDSPLAQAVFRFLDDPAPSSPEPEPDACADVQAALTRAFEATTAQLSGPGGVVAAVRTGCGNLAFAAGTSGRAALTAETPVRIGSITKTFTAALVLRAAEQGRLSLDDRLARWMPRFINADRITVTQLLNHTAGLGDITDDADFMQQVRADPERVWTPQEVLQAAAAQPPEFEPGAGWSYSNSNYLVLGFIAARAFDQDYATLIGRELFAPLGLERSVFETRGAADGLARGYDARGRDITDTIHPSVRGAAGAVAAPIAELAAWGEALLAGDLLAPSTWASMARTVPTGTANSRWGLGPQWLEHPRLGTLIGHTGSTPGFSSALRYAPELEATVAVTSTSDSELAGRLTEALLDALAQ